MSLRRLSGARTDQTTAALVDRAEVLAGRASDPSVVVEELIAVAERRQFILDTAYAVAVKRHRDETEANLSVQLLEMANYTLQHRRRAGARTVRLWSSMNLVLHGSVLLLVMGATVWVARRAVIERDGLLGIAALFTAVVSLQLVYNIRKRTLFPAAERSEAMQRAAITSESGRAKTIPELAADTLLTARRLATEEKTATDPMGEVIRTARNGQTGPVAEYLAKLVLEEALRRASFIPPVRTLTRRIYTIIQDAQRTIS
jgi:hypothetical protein